MLGTTLLICLQTSLAATSATPAAPVSYKQAYQQTAQTGQPLVVLVGTDWCPACVKMKRGLIPRLRERGRMDQVAFTCVDADQEKELATKLMTGGTIPQLIVFRKTDKGWEREQLIGGKTVEEAEELIAKGKTPATNAVMTR